jgi:hypothetical protein
VIVSFGVLIGILFLEETHAEKKHRHDPGLETGKWIISQLSRCADLKPSRNEKVDDPDEILALLNDDDQPPGYQTTDGSPVLPSTPSPEPQESLDLNDAPLTARPNNAATKAFTRQVVLNIVGYGILA